MADRPRGAGLYQPQDEQQAKLIFEVEKERKIERGKLLLNGGFSYDGESLDILTHRPSAASAAHHMCGVQPSDQSAQYHLEMNSVVRGTPQLPVAQDRLQNLHGFSPHYNETVQTYHPTPSDGISHPVSTLQATFDLDTFSQSRAPLIPRGQGPYSSVTEAVSISHPGPSFSASDPQSRPSYPTSNVKPSTSSKSQVATSRSVIASNPPENATGHKLRLKISKGTKVHTSPPSPEVIVIEDDEEDNDASEKLSLVTVPESAQNNSETRATENKLEFPEKYIPNMHLLDLPTFEEPFVDIRHNRPNRKPGKRSTAKISPEYFEEAISQAASSMQVASTSTQGRSAGVQPVSDSAGNDGIGINVRMDDDLDIINILEMIPSNLDQVDISVFDLEMEEEKTLKKQKYSVYQPFKVVTGEKEAVVDLLNKKEQLTTGVHGVICDALEPSAYGSYSKEEFVVKKVVGKGSYGTVDLCEDKSTRREFVKKQVTKDFRNTEVLIMLYLDHVNITKLYGYIQRDGQPEVLMEFVGVNLLSFVLISPDRLDNDAIWNLSKQGLSALEYLDNHSIIHLDLKPENICIVDNGSSLTLKLTDFGSAKTALESMTYQGLTAEYMAPEISRAFLKSRYPTMFQSNEDFVISGKSDVFALALVIMYMFQKFHVLMHFFTHGKTTYKDVENPDKVRLSIIIAGARKPDTVKTLMITDKCSPNMRVLLEGMLEGCPKQRLSAREVLSKMDGMEKGDVYQQPMSPLEVLHSYVPLETKVSAVPLRHRSSVPSSTSVCSMDVSNPGSPGPVRNLPERRKNRRRSQRPYEGGAVLRGGEGFHGIQVAENVQGNVPNFQAL